MNNTIYWFSGTGNSLYVAKALAKAMSGTELASMAGSVSAEAVGGEGCKVGFVFPSYYGNLPRRVRAFAQALKVLPGTDLFAVITMGAFGQGSVQAMESLLAERGLALRYGVGVRINGNYILKYDPALFGAKSAGNIETKLDKADRQILQIAAEIESGRRQLQKGFITAKTLYENISSLDSEFTVSETCTSCGLCEKICPVRNIQLANGKLTWLHHCEHCVACISWCPAAAINCGRATKRRTRYHNPRIQAAELEYKQGENHDAI